MVLPAWSGYQEAPIDQGLESHYGRELEQRNGLDQVTSRSEHRDPAQLGIGHIDHAVGAKPGEPWLGEFSRAIALTPENMYKLSGPIEKLHIAFRHVPQQNISRLVYVDPRKPDDWGRVRLFQHHGIHQRELRQETCTGDSGLLGSRVFGAITLAPEN
jgi:hypothetical protein